MILGVAVAAVILVWGLSSRSAALQAVILGLYEARPLPYVFRVLLASGPIWALAILFLGLASAVPASIGRWFALLFFDALAVALAVVFWRPRVALPRWLRDRIMTGEIEAAVPSGSDWIYFWFFVPAAVLVTLGFPLLLRSP